MISFDETMVAASDSKPGDTRARHAKYAGALKRQDPDASLTILVKASCSHPAHPIALSEGCTVYPIPCRRWAFVWKAWQILQPLIRSERFDVVTTQTPFDDGLLGVWLKRKRHIPLNVQMRSSFLDISYWIRERPVVYRLFNVVGKWVCRQADTIRVVCDGERARLEQRFPAWRGKIIALHPLVNLPMFTAPVQEDEKARVQAYLHQHKMETRPFFLFVGRLVMQKNLPTLLHAFAAVRRQTPDAVLVIAGDGPLRPRLERVVRQLYLTNHIVWLGNLSLQALRGWYASARATLLPSFHEGFGKVIVESYLLGAPVIASSFVSASELIQHEKTGFIVQSFTDSASFANHMSAFLKSAELASRMGAKGREHILRYLLPETSYMERLINIWQITVENRRV